jgi:hypothetical protein
MAFVAIKIGRRSGQGRTRRARIRSDTQPTLRPRDSRRPIFIVILRAAAGWLFFRVTHSARINADMLVVNASPARTALKNSQLIPRPRDESYVTSGTGH